MLWEWREGKKSKSSSDSHKTKGAKFEGDSFKKVYDRHMNTLMVKKKINSYHYVMSTLYSKVMYVFTIFFIVILYSTLL